MKKQTIGERIVVSSGAAVSIDYLRTSPSHPQPRNRAIARYIDSAIRRAVKEAFEAGERYASAHIGPSSRIAIITPIQRKYRVKL